MNLVSGGSQQPLHGGNQRKKWSCHWPLFVVFMFLGTSESFIVSKKASDSVNVLPFSWRQAPSPSSVQTKDLRITADSTGGKDSAKKTAKDTNSASYSVIHAWFAKQAYSSTTPTKSRTSSEDPKKIDKARNGTSNTEREIYGYPDVQELQKLVDGIKASSSASPSTTKSPVVSASPSPVVVASPSPAIPSPTAPATEPSSPEPGLEDPAVWSEPLPVPESEVTPGSETEKPYFIPDCGREEPYRTPETEIEEPQSIPSIEIDKPYSAPETEIEEPQSIPAIEIEEPYSTPEIEVEPYSSTPEIEVEPYSSTPEIEIEPLSIPDTEEPVSSPDTMQSESSEAPVSDQSEVPSEPEESPFSAEEPEAYPSMEIMPFPEPSPPPTPLVKRVTLEDIKEANKGVTIRVDGPKGKIGVLVPVGVTVKLKDAIIEVPDDIAVVIGVNGGNVEMKNVQLVFEQQSRVSRRALQNITQSMTKQGLALTNGSNADISNSRFEGSTDSMVSLETGSILNCKGCVFHQNIAQERGGAIMAKGSSVILEDCTFSNNESPNGGAVWMSGAHHGDEASYLNIRDSVFVYNKVDNEGGTLWVKNVHKVEVLDSRFSSGIGVNKGGALVVENTRDLRIVGSHFDNNEAKTSSGGAASLAFCSTIEILNSTFESNSALLGGSATIYSDARGGGQVNIKNTRFNENKAQSRGGAILLQTIVSNSNATSAYTHVSIDQSSFINNTAANGGAIYVSSESGANSNLNVEVKNTEFLQNSATDAGGGIYCGRQSSINFDSSVFQQNEAHTGKGCATACGCSIHRKQTDNVELQDAGGDSSPHCDSSATPSTAGETSGSSNTVTYVMVVLAVLVALIIILVGVFSKNQYGFHFNRRTELLRSLTSFNDATFLPPQDLSAPLNESTEDLPNEANASEASAGRWMGSYTYEEMDCPAPPRSTDLSQTGSVKGHFLSEPEDGEEARAAGAILTDDAFQSDTRESHSNPTEDTL